MPPVTYSAATHFRGLTNWYPEPREMVVFVLAIALEISPEAAASPNYVLAAPDYVPESDLEEEPLLDDLSGNNIFETARLEVQAAPRTTRTTLDCTYTTCFTPSTTILV
nr:hypothetical protein [Tanacetum cinerariifolium]